MSQLLEEMPYGDPGFASEFGGPSRKKVPVVIRCGRHKYTEWDEDEYG